LESDRATAATAPIGRFSHAQARVTWSTVSGQAGPIRWAISARVGIEMNFSASLLEWTIIAVDYCFHRAISGAWESVCRDALRRQQLPPEEDYGGGDICSLEETPSTEDDQPLE
jgi:hypothetical protein